MFQRFTILAFALFSVASCSYFKKSAGPTGEDVIARVNDDYLYASDLSGATLGLHGEDSLKVLKTYAESWVRKKLLLQKAQDNISDQDVGIAKKVEDYRETLLLYEYEKELIDQKLDTVMKPGEMEAAYEKVKQDFQVEEDVYRLAYIKLPKDAPDLKDARKWILKPKDEEEKRKLEGYCKDVALSYSTDEGAWYAKEKALKNFPVNAGELASLSGSFKEFKTDDVIWFIKVTDKVSQGQSAPLELIRDKVVKMIVEKRKMQLLEKTYNRIYQDGKKSYEIFVK